MLILGLFAIHFLWNVTARFPAFSPLSPLGDLIWGFRTKNVKKHVPFLVEKKEKVGYTVVVK